MDKRLSSDHPVRQLPPRIPDRFDDLPIRIGSSIIERGDGSAANVASSRGRRIPT
jgi:hypothetical protein